jgi:hypothetical protein
MKRRILIATASLVILIAVVVIASNVVRAHNQAHVSVSRTPPVGQQMAPFSTFNICTPRPDGTPYSIPPNEPQNECDTPTAAK